MHILAGRVPLLDSWKECLSTYVHAFHLKPYNVDLYMLYYIQDLGTRLENRSKLPLHQFAGIFQEVLLYRLYSIICSFFARIQTR